MQNMQAICWVWWYCSILHEICKICKIICTICKICKHHFQYAEYSPPTLLMWKARVAGCRCWVDTDLARLAQAGPAGAQDRRILVGGPAARQPACHSDIVGGKNPDAGPGPMHRLASHAYQALSKDSTWNSGLPVTMPVTIMARGCQCDSHQLRIKAEERKSEDEKNAVTAKKIRCVNNWTHHGRLGNLKF